MASGGVAVYFCGERSGGSRTRPIHPCHGLTCESPSKAYLPDRRKSPRQSQPEGPWAREGRGAPHPAGWATVGTGLFSPAEVIGATCWAHDGRPRVGNLAACVHTSYNFRHESISPSTFSQLVARRIPAPVRNLVPCVHARRDIRHGGRLRPRQGQKVRPTCTHGTRFPTWTRQGGAFPLLAGSIGLSPVRNSIPCVHARRDFRHVHRWTTGSESKCPRSRTPSALVWPPAGKRGLEPQPSATGPNTARRHYPHSSSARLPRALLSTRPPAGTELQR